MALSLAACGGSETPAITQAELDAQTSAATAAAAAQAAAEAEAAAAAAAQAAAEADAATAAEAQAAAEAAQAAAEAEAAAAAEAQAAAEAAQAAAQAELDVLTTPISTALTDDDATGVGADTPAMTAGDDTISATSATYDATDIIVDSKTTDADSITVTATGDISAAPTIVNVEALAFNLSAVAAAGGDDAQTFDVAVTNISGASSMSFDVSSVGSAVTKLAVDDVKSGAVINSSDDFTTITVTSVDNANYTVNATAATATTAIDFTDAGTTAHDVTVASTGALTLESVAADGDLVITAAGDMDVEAADAAETMAATSTAGSIGITSMNGVETLTLTAKDEVTVAEVGAATSVTVSAMGNSDVTGGGTTSTLAAAAATDITISGNGGAIKVDATGADAMDTVTLTGGYSIEIVAEVADVTTEVFVDSTTAGTTTLLLDDVGEGVDLEDAAVDVIKLGADMDGGDFDIASGATIHLGASSEDSTAALSLDMEYATRASNEVTIVVADDTSTTAETSYVNDVAVVYASTVNLSSNDADPDAAGVDVESIDVETAALNVTGSVGFQLDSVTAASFNAGTATGAIDIDLEGTATVGDVTTGPGNDTVVVSGDLSTGGYTISTGAGTDSITLEEASDQTVDGGAGADTVTMDGDYTAETISITGVEIIELDNESVIDGSMLTGQAIVLRDTGDAEADFFVTVDTATVDFSNISVDSSTITGATFTATSYGAFTGVTVTGTGVADTITGGANGDTLTGANAADTIDGAAGGDVIYGDEGADTLTGGAGGDVIYGGDDADSIFVGNAGNKESFVIDLIGTGNNAAAAAGDLHNITIFGEQITYDDEAGDLDAAAEGLAAAINTAFGDLVTATDNGGVEVTITSLVDGVTAIDTGDVTDDEGENAAEYTAEAGAVEGTLGSDGNDTIYAGEGADLIFLGDGTNTVDLTETTSAADVVHFTNAVDDLQTVVSFKINKDTLDFNGMDLTDGTAAVDIAADAATAEVGAGAVTVFANGADGTGSGLESVIVDYTDLVDVAAFIEAGLDIDANEEGIVIINDLAGDDAYIYALDGTNDTNITSADLDLIGVVSDIGSTPLDANDIVA